METLERKEDGDDKDLQDHRPLLQDQAEKEKNQE